MKFKNIVKYNKIKAAEQPTTPKPIATLPDNMVWAWDPKGNQWIAVMKDNPVVTPPTYNPNNLQNTSTTTQMYTPVKAASTHYDGLNIIKIYKLNGQTVCKITEYKGNYGVDTIDSTTISSAKDLDDAINIAENFYKKYVKKVKSTLIDSLNQFLSGDKYSREIKIEKGLISDGLIKLAGINPIRGPKYSITDKGLELLKQVAQEEYDFEKDYIKARKSYLLDGISEEEFKTGAPESQGQMPKFSIFEKDGSELAQIEAKNSTDAKVKFFLENPEYEGSQTIEVKKVNAKEHLQVGDKVKVVMPGNEYWNNYIGTIDYIEGDDDFDAVTIIGNKPIQMFDRKNVIKIGKEIDSTYSETTTQGLDFPNQPISPSTDIKVDTCGWVNQAALKRKADMIDDLTFEADMSDIEIEMGYGFSYDNKEIFAKLKEKYPQLANVIEPEIYDIKGYGTIKWGLDIEARNWGFHTLKLRALPAKITLKFDIHYFENEQDKENSDDTSSYFELDFDLTDIDIESEFNLNSNDDLFVHKIEINGFDSATLYA